MPTDVPSSTPTNAPTDVPSVAPTNAPTDVPFGGTASQSSTYSTGVASLAIDGNLDTMWSGRSVTHTESELNPWWKYVLDREEIVGSIRVYNRGDS